MRSKVNILKERIRAARGEIPPDLVLKSGKVVDVFCGEIREGDVAVHQGGIVGVGPGYSGREEVDCRGKWIVPGFIDGHLHIESSMVLPSGLAAALAPWGTAAIVADPHEIANVMGLDGVRLMLEDSRSAPVDVFFMAPSCVPATHLESSGAGLPASELKSLMKQPRILGLAEMMNYPGVLAGADEVLEKIVLFRDKVIDGHAPGLGGRDLQAYLTAGIRSDHETTDRGSGMEKVNQGMMVMIREGTSARNLEELVPLVSDRNFWRFCFVSDDLHPRDILERGHLNFMVRKAVQLGLDPVTAVRLATISPASYFGLRDRGAVAPGYKADLAVLEDLESFSVNRVYKNGMLVAEDGNLCVGVSRKRKPSEAEPLKVAGLSLESFRIPACAGNGRIIELVPHQIVTRTRYEPVKCENGFVQADVASDILRLAVVERHHGTGRIGLGLVKGFGLKTGALASSVAHDSHNIIAVGVGEEDLLLAVREVVNMGGGISVASGDRVLSRMPLEIGGLMTAALIRDVAVRMEELLRAAASLGCTVPEPFMILSFLALPVIPESRLTDLGLVDVNRFEVVPLFVE
ncbi:MAG: adenine deaminase [Desulfobacterales bacterium]|nr:adenine deaminase [Desulfobacterales bacterium]